MITEAVLCLATAVFFEARNEPIEGQMLVAETVMNRVEHPAYPNNVCEVVFQRKQFSFTHDGKSDNIYKYKSKPDSDARKTAIAVAKKIVQSRREYPEVTHYHATYVDPYWANDMFKVTQVGQHIFYTMEE